MDNEELRQRLREALRFSSLEEAEQSLRTIHTLCAECLAAGNRDGAQLCRRRVVEGKKRASLMFRNHRLSPEKRSQKEEIHRWFYLWLEDPDTFFKWLALRKDTVEYQRLSGLKEQR